MRIFYVPFVITCSKCRHRNRPHKSPREGIRMGFLGTIPPCKGCGKVLRPNMATLTRPLAREVRSELIREGLLPAGVHQDISPTPH